MSEEVTWDDLANAIRDVITADSIEASAYGMARAYPESDEKWDAFYKANDERDSKRVEMWRKFYRLASQSGGNPV
jgi:hypothetical protein